MYGKKRKQSLSSSATHWPVVLFLAGRTKLSNVSPDTLKKGLHNPKRDGDVTEVNVSLLHLLYETQSPHHIQSTLVTSRKYLSVSGQSALDWFVIGYCIANSTGVWKLEKTAGDKHNYLNQLIMGLNLASEEISGQRGKMGSLILSGFCLATVQSLSKISIKTCHTESMTELELSHPKHERGVADIDVSSQYPKLEVLVIKAYDTINISSFTECKLLNTLILEKCSLCIDDIKSVMHCHLCYLSLSQCVISIPDRTLQATINEGTLESLDITGSLSVLDQMIPTIRMFTQLIKLKLHFNQVDSSSSEILENLHSCCPVLESLTVWCDKLFSLPFSFLCVKLFSLPFLGVMNHFNFFVFLQCSVCFLSKEYFTHPVTEEV